MKNADTPAFPEIDSYKEHKSWDESVGDFKVRKYTTSGGLTKREYFAGLAMQGILATEVMYNATPAIAKASVKLADELLKQLEK